MEPNNWVCRVICWVQKLYGDELAIVSDNQKHTSEHLTKEKARTVQICIRVLASWPL